jgi:hypothetical protein
MTLTSTPRREQRSPTPFHQDTSYFAMEGDVAGFWISFEDVPLQGATDRGLRGLT